MVPWLLAASLSVGPPSDPVPQACAADAPANEPADEPADEVVPVGIRLTWGGGKPGRWSGRIAVEGRPGAIVQARSLCPEPDANASFHLADGQLVVHQPSERLFDGIELVLDRWANDRLVVELESDGRPESRSKVELPIADLLASSRQHPLDQEGNRLLARRVPGDAIHVGFRSAAETSVAGPSAAIAGPPSAETFVRRPGEIVRLWVRPSVDAKSTKAVECELRLRLLGGGRQLFEAAVPLPVSAPAAGPIRSFAEVPVDVPLPTREGVYDLELDVVERGGLRWSRAVASRSVQFVAVAAASPTASPEKMQVVYELDPGSPRLLDRLRRLPGVGMPAMPSLPKPQLPLPAIGMPSLPVPAAGIPKLSARLPAVDALLPRGGGLVAAGDSVVEPHVFGPMLRLPAAASFDEPSWDGIAIPSARPGLPHVVEVEYPNDQDATVVLAVIEPAAAVQAVSAEGGFRVRKPAFGEGGPRIEVHRFVFWPKTRSPVVLLANPSPSHPALLGRIRVLAGPERLPPAERPSGRGVASRAGGRERLGYLSKPDFSRFAQVEKVDPESRRPIHDWSTFLAGIGRCAEQLESQGADGAMVAVYADGAAAWPTPVGLAGPRWDGGVFADRGQDPSPKDILELMLRVFERERLSLVAAVECSGPLAPLEAALAGPAGECVGIACVGRDGRPAAGDPRSRRHHYNILDPRVQDAVAAVVSDLAERIGRSTAASGVAVLVGHDGWMHLPGIAWGLDDATFRRFSEQTGIEVPREGADRFERRALLVEGPARKAWLEWRAGVIAAFSARLADEVARRRPSLELHFVLTTLVSDGPMAERFRPTLPDGQAEAGALLEMGIDPAAIASHSRVVFVSPQQRVAADDIVAEGTLDRMQRSLPVVRQLARVPRRAAILLDRPVDVDLRRAGRLLGSGGGSLDAASSARLHAVDSGAARLRAVAEALLPADCERVIDESLLIDLAGSDVGEQARAFASLPRRPMETLDRLPAPLVVRTVRDGDRLSICVVNASGARCTASITTDRGWTSVVDAVRGGPLASPVAGQASGADDRPAWQVPLGPWEVRALEASGGGEVTAVGVVHDEQVRTAVQERLATLRRRRASLETPTPLDVLDNPAFELPSAGGAVPGWELVEAARGSIDVVATGGGGAGGAGTRAVRFASDHGLSTLQSNAFLPPRTGRVSVAAWLKLDDGGGQPPLRIAVEGREGDRQYYRYAPVGLGPGSMPLKSDWSQVVLQIDDLPTRAMQSLRVRFDLVGPGRVQIDDVRVFDLAFEESQRVQLSKSLALVDHHLASGDVGTAVVELEAHWPRFLMEMVPEPPAPLSETPQQAAADKAGGKPDAVRSSMIEKMRRWWQ